MKRLIIAFMFTFLAFNLIAQDDKSFEVVPKQFSVEIGARYNFMNDFTDSKTPGYGMLLDYAWQLSGFNKQKAGSYISVPLGYTYFAEADSSIALLSYGWTVRHNLAKNRKLTPFVGYSLLLNQLRIQGIEGSVMGHKTAMWFGFDFNTNRLIKPYLRFEYSYSRFGELGLSHGNKIQGVEFIIGMRIK